MNHQRLTKRHQAPLLALLALTGASPVLLQAAATVSWMPEWLGAAVAVAALFGSLLVLWRAGALRMRYVALFAGALVLAAAWGPRLAQL